MKKLVSGSTKGSRYRDLARVSISRYEMYNFYTSDNDEQSTVEKIYASYASAIDEFYYEFTQLSIENNRNSIFQMANCCRDIAHLLYRVPINGHIKKLLVDVLKKIKTSVQDFSLSADSSITLFESEVLSDFLYAAYLLYKKSENSFFSSILLSEYIHYNIKTERLTEQEFNECVYLLGQYVNSNSNIYLKTWAMSFSSHIISLKCLHSRGSFSADQALRDIKQNYQNIIDSYANLNTRIDPKIAFGYLYIRVYEGLKLLNDDSHGILENRFNLEIHEIFSVLSDLEKIVILSAYAIKNNDQILKTQVIKALQNLLSFSEVVSPLKVIEISSHKNFFSSERFMLSLLYQLIDKSHDGTLVHQSLSQEIEIIEQDNTNIFNPIWFLYQTPVTTYVQFEKQSIMIEDKSTLTLRVLIQVTPSMLDERTSYEIEFKTDNDIQVLCYPINNLELFNHRVEEFDLDISYIPISTKFGLYACINMNLNRKGHSTKIELSRDHIICGVSPTMSNIKKVVKFVNFLRGN